jgi:hypothetical protein
MTPPAHRAVPLLLAFVALAQSARAIFVDAVNNCGEPVA